MTQAPIGAVLSYWLRPTPERAHIHRIEVEHALYLADANQEQIKETLTEMLRHQTGTIENFALALDELRDEIAAGFSAVATGVFAVAEGVARVDQTLRQGFYKLHLDELGTHKRLDDLLLLMHDKKGYEREALARIQSLIDHDEAITAFARDLQIANNQPWDNNACILALEGALARHDTLLKQSSRLSNVQRQFDDQRRFSATERFMESCSFIIQELHVLRPDMRVYYDAARYAISAGQSTQALPWIKHCYDAQSTVHAFLLEAMADEELQKYEVGTFLRQA